MNRARVMEVVDKIKFHDWSFKCGYTTNEGLTLHISASVPDAVESLQRGYSVNRVVLGVWVTMPPFANEDEVIGFVHHCVRSMVAHETDEFFWYDGTVPFNPHKEHVL